MTRYPFLPFFFLPTRARNSRDVSLFCRQLESMLYTRKQSSRGQLTLCPIRVCIRPREKAELRTLHRPNSDKTPPPRPVSVHLFLIALGLVCDRDGTSRLSSSTRGGEKVGPHLARERVELEHGGRTDFRVDRLVPDNVEVCSPQELVRCLAAIGGL